MKASMEDSLKEVQCHDTGYEDILKERRDSSDLRWAVREWSEAVVYQNRQNIDKTDLFTAILTSERISFIINELIEDGHNRKELVKRVLSILEDMSHSLNIGMIRKFGFVLPKIMKKIYKKVLVNSAGISMLKNAIRVTPVLLLPSHRSYADFLLVSYISFHYNLPLPVIAAGMDFMSMAVIGDMLRGSGAFYIRRSFMDDKLYWAVFQEYVQFLICKSGQPVEFFLEGTRSRSGKSLPPKLGLLGCAVECWLRGKLPDIAIVPISISYSRTLEEKLYAYEMLGVPKPKESTSGLLKAMKILKETFGNVYVRFGAPIYVSKFMAPKVQRHLYSAPFHLSQLNKDEFDACEGLALHILRTLQKNSVLSVWSLSCVTLQRLLWLGIWQVTFESLSRKTLELANLALKAGSSIEGSASPELLKDHLRSGLMDHKEVASLESDGTVHIRVIHKETESKKTLKDQVFFLKESTISQSVTHLLLQYYVNQTLHVFIRLSLVSFAVKSYGLNHIPLDYITARYNLLVAIFSNDFIFELECQEQDIMASLALLRDAKHLSIQGDTVHLLSRENTSHLDFYTDLLKPFLLNYQCASQVASQQTWESEASFVSAMQLYMEASVQESLLYSALSQDTCRHALKMLLKFSALTKERNSSSRVVLVPDLERISFIQEVLRPSLIVANYMKPKL